MSSDDLLRQQIELTFRIINRMDDIIKHMRENQHTEKIQQEKDEATVYYKPHTRPEWVNFTDPWGNTHVMPAETVPNDWIENTNDIELLRRIIVGQRAVINKLLIERNKLRGVES